MECTSPCLTCIAVGWGECTSCNGYRKLENYTCQCDDANPTRSARSVVTPMMIAYFSGDYATLEMNSSTLDTSSWDVAEDVCLVFTACANDGFYRDEHSGECMACDSSCGTCVGPSLAHCTSCPEGTHHETLNAEVQYGACLCNKTSTYYDATTR
jgi:hypothetical protein